MTKRKTITGYLAIEENGVEVWPKALVEAVYLACSEEMQRLMEVGTEKVVKMIPVCHRSRHVAVLLIHVVSNAKIAGSKSYHAD